MQHPPLDALAAAPLAWPLTRAVAAVAAAAAVAERAAAASRGATSQLVPAASTIDAALAAAAGVRFVEAAPRTRRRRGAPADPAAYDASIVERGEVPTRPGNLHDLANALVWATFPRSKRALHTRQLGVVRAAALPGQPWTRSEEGDALAMVDEGGLVIVAAEQHIAAIEDELARGDDDALSRRVARGEALGVVFGHAIVEQLARAAPPVAGLALALPGDPTSPDLAALDLALAARIADPASFRSRRGHGIASARPDVLGVHPVVSPTLPARHAPPAVPGAPTVASPAVPAAATMLVLGALALLGASGCDPAPEPAIAATASAAAPTVSAWLPSLTGVPAPSIAPAVASRPSLAAPPASAAASLSASASAPASAVASGDPSAPPAPCPDDMVLSGRTCVDRHEAHLRVPGPDGALVLHPYNERPPAGVRFVAANAAGQKPQGYISRVESLAACTAAGKRLCTRPEWQRACRGPSGSRWPYGQHGDRSRCNSGKPHLLTVHFGDVRSIKYDEHFNSPILNADPVGLAPSAQYAGCTNEVGTFDMVGNLHEWVAGTVDADFVYEMEEEKVERRDQPWQSGNAIFMGGFYSTTSEHGPGCTFTTIAHEPSYHDYSTGFRCCRDAQLPPRAGKPLRGPPRP